MNEFSPDENTIESARNGDKAAMNELVTALAPTVKSIANAYVGRSPLTRNDLIQEGMIGLLSSVYGYSSCENAQFKTYARTCISNRIMSAVRNQLRNKHEPLNNYMLIDDIDLPDIKADPKLILEMQDSMDNLNERIGKELTSLERNVLTLHIGGHNYSSIAEILSVNAKTVDNALQRARKKLKENDT